MKKLFIIMPAHNEEKRIGRTLEAYSRYFEDARSRSILDYKILVVINNTQDKTEGIVRYFIKKNRCIRYLNFKQGGKGFAVIEGFKEGLKADYDLIGFVDADMATPPEEYANLINSISNYDGAIADRYIKGSKVYPPVTFRRLIVGRVFNFIIRSIMLLPYKDTQCGAKVFRRKALEKVIPRLSMSQWAFDVELLYHIKKNNFSIVSCPTKWIDREYSKINFWKAGPWMLLGIIRLRILNSPFKRFIRIYDKFIGFIPR